MRVAVTGHRPEAWAHEAGRLRARQALWYALRELQPAVVLSGMARGADDYVCLINERLLTLPEFASGVGRDDRLAEIDQ